MDLVENNVKQIRQSINEVCNKINRNPDEITIIAASKTRDAETINDLVKNTEIKICGENRVQEFNEKHDSCYGVDWHFIGRLQTNKVKYLIGKVSLIHSVDRVELAEKIDELSKKKGVVTNVLIEVNMGGELSKGGLNENEVVDFIKSLSDKQNIKIMGIMSVMPNEEESVIAPLYDRLYDLFNSLKELKQDNFEAKYLSCGMSNDYLLAIKHGSNMVRIGTGIFGPRNYNI